MSASSDKPCPCDSGKMFSECHGAGEATPAAPPPAESGPRVRQITPSGRPRGFAAMDPRLVSEIARKGGKAAHRAGTAHEFTSAEARAAGRKGGRISHERKRARGEE